MIYINLIIVFIVLVMIHEFGHYIVARFFKAKVTDFSIGFGKAIFKFTDKNGTTWKIAPIPLGGYVKIKGLGTKDLSQFFRRQKLDVDHAIGNIFIPAILIS